ncbi:MAG: fused MFS/spermidine synthase [Beijerinckiaceae bacterium]|nr:fused MFS/spermidine synthase [Beijerinckiaceae bacterium]MCZ8298708.1 fused MFS/spermidine synthase [Beijerinckiaceae bacterium]
MADEAMITGNRVAMRPGSGPARAAVTLGVFTLAIFTSAFLLFAIQPMFTKMVLPLLGGSPSVWSVAMVFFQALLLAGYLYAHLLTTRLSPRIAAFVHLGLMAITLLALPIAISDQLGAPPSEGQALWLIGLFLASVGLPFFAIAGNGPLLQAWFARTGHPHANDPYFLYGASNLGSFAALLLYPVAIEPMLNLRSQTMGWSVGFVLLAGLIGLAVLRLGATAPQSVTKAEDTAADRPGFRTILGWITLSFIPSGLLVAVTAHLSTDVAAAPFMWVIPLALFLLTFVLIFRDRPLVPMAAVERMLPILAAGLVLFSYFGARMFLMVFAVQVAFFFAATLVCHARLYAARPAARHLTTFYLWMSFGGVLGGLFCGLIAPVIFDRVIEYPLLVIAAVLALPALGKIGRAAMIRQVVPVLVLGALYLGALFLVASQSGPELGEALPALFVASAFLCLLVYRRPAIVAAMLPILFIALNVMQQVVNQREHERSFFGVHKLELRENGQLRILSHGTTVHGAMRIRNADGTPYTGRPKPLTYYHPEAPIAEGLRAVPPRPEGRRVGVVGLGAGAHACNGVETDRWTFFEIDASVVRIAKDPAQFRFLSECTPAARIVLGDARLTLAHEPKAAFDSLLIDAFSSDSIPTHLLTREALALYLDRLAEDGVLTLHISNRHLELESVVAALARDAGAVALYKADPGEGRPTLEARIPSMVVVMAKSAAPLKPFEALEGWRPIRDRGVAVWTDDFSNIVGALMRHYRGQ